MSSWIEWTALASRYANDIVGLRLASQRARAHLQRTDMSFRRRLGLCLGKG
jgi:hypothetical protein